MISRNFKGTLGESGYTAHVHKCQVCGSPTNCLFRMNRIDYGRLILVCSEDCLDKKEQNLIDRTIDAQITSEEEE